MDTNTLLIIVLVVILLGGGGFTFGGPDRPCAAPRLSAALLHRRTRAVSSPTLEVLCRRMSLVLPQCCQCRMSLTPRRRHRAATMQLSCWRASR
jgi:hypothetical protein